MVHRIHDFFQAVTKNVLVSGSMVEIKPLLIKQLNFFKNLQLTTGNF
jgi:hypothetical protein